MRSGELLPLGDAEVRCMFRFMLHDRRHTLLRGPGANLCRRRTWLPRLESGDRMRFRWLLRLSDPAMQGVHEFLSDSRQHSVLRLPDADLSGGFLRLSWMVIASLVWRWQLLRLRLKPVFDVQQRMQYRRSVQVQRQQGPGLPEGCTRLPCPPGCRCLPVPPVLRFQSSELPSTSEPCDCPIERCRSRTMQVRQHAVGRHLLNRPRGGERVGFRACRCFSIHCRAVVPQRACGQHRHYRYVQA